MVENINSKEAYDLLRKDTFLKYRHILLKHPLLDQTCCLSTNQDFSYHFQKQIQNLKNNGVEDALHNLKKYYSGLFYIFYVGLDENLPRNSLKNDKSKKWFVE